jgi:hypothetical protein
MTNTKKPVFSNFKFKSNCHFLEFKAKIELLKKTIRNALTVKNKELEPSYLFLVVASFSFRSL